MASTGEPIKDMNTLGQGVEQEHKPDKVALIACMDENLGYGAGVYVVGVGGTGVSKLEGGKQELFPDEKRALVERVRLQVFAAIKEVALELDMELGGTSHLGCGWAGGQGIGAEDVPAVTERVLADAEITYWGHIPHAPEPVDLDKKPGVQAFIERPESDHHHGARSVVLTVGGFITQEEIDQVSTEYGDAFIISADWLAKAVDSGLSIEDALAFLAVQVDIADGIADGVTKGSSCQIFNAGRLDGVEAHRNEQWVKSLLDRLAVK